MGTTATALGIVLGAFMGGMAVGSFLSVRFEIAKTKPVLVFATLEGFVGLYALASPYLLDAIGAVPADRVFLPLGLALGALLPATAAMGASLPILAHALSRAHRSDLASVTVGKLYAANTAGALLGPLLAVFALFPSFGLSTTMVIAASIDLAVSIGLLSLRKHLGLDEVPEPSEREDSFEPVDAKPSSASLLGDVPMGIAIAVFVSGASAMTYEVAWGRTLSMVYGSSVYGVSLMLSTFLFGIALGSAGAARWLRHRSGQNSMRRLASALIASAFLAFVSLIVSRSLPFVFLNFYTSFEGSPNALYVSQFVIACALMLPSTLALGATLPLGVDALGAKFSGARVAQLYSWNLVGSATGAIGASALLVASFGLEFAIRAAAVLVLVTAIVLLARETAFSVPRGAFAGALVVIIVALDPSGDGSLKSFGVYSGARTYAQYDPAQMRQIVASHELLYYRDGPTATVAVQRIDRFLLLKINGKTDASNGPGDVQTQLLLGHLPFLAARDEPRRVAVLGWGSGMTVGAVLQHPVSSVDAFEIEPAVVEASRFFDSFTGAPLDDDRVRLVLGDARGELRRGEDTYDIIISEPSNPWLTGVANLFTKDFFEIAEKRLAPNGIVCQWFHLYGMSEESTRSLIATFRDVFPHVVAFRDRDLILLGSREPLELSMSRLEEFYESDSIRDSLIEAGVKYPSDVLASMTLDEQGARALSENAPLNTDDNMRLELSAPRTLYRDEVDAILETMRERTPDVVAHLEDVELESPREAAVRLEIAASLFTDGRMERARSEAERAVAIHPTFESQKLLGQIFERLGDPARARSSLEGALQAAGGDAEGRRFVEAMLRSLDSPSGS
jgi:spermidine synthase